ncbi:MAG TPA: sensor domain-containing diguanylate cyclase [Kofleriaceae bacterium]|nr:sensor domain-containing diguanylate cyclase [Kofleriaceae bacterium]
MAVGDRGGGTEGDGYAFDAVARALGCALSVPLVVISRATPHAQKVIGVYESERGIGAPVLAVSATALCHLVVQGAKPVIVHDVRRRIAVGSDALAAMDIAGYAAVPIVVEDFAVGAVAALDHLVRAWSDRDVELLRSFADMMARMFALEAAIKHERALTSLRLQIAAATGVQEVVEAVAMHIGWSRAALVTVEGGLVRTLAAHDGDRPGTRIVATPWPVDTDPVVRDALQRRAPVWHAETCAIAIPDSSAVLQLSTDDEGSQDRLDVERIAPSLAALVGAVLQRAAPDDALDRRTGELEALALHDELTGLLNRRGFHAVAGGQLAIARRKGIPGMVLFVDIDGLKAVNDRDGHSAGDALLRLAGQVLRSTFRDADTIGRLGGDEFVVFSIDATEADHAAVIGRLSSELARANESTDPISRLRWSVGHVCFDGAAADSLANLIVEADRRMYSVKRTTGGRLS